MVNTFKVKVYPKDLKSIPDIMPYNKLIHGEPVELELNKNEIIRCMNYGDVFDLSSGDEVLIDEITVKELEEFVVKEGEEQGTEEGDPEASTRMGTVPNHVQSPNAAVVGSAATAPEKPKAEPEKPQVQNDQPRKQQAQNNQQKPQVNNQTNNAQKKQDENKSENK